MRKIFEKFLLFLNNDGKPSPIETISFFRPFRPIHNLIGPTLYYRVFRPKRNKGYEFIRRVKITLQPGLLNGSDHFGPKTGPDLVFLLWSEIGPAYNNPIFLCIMRARPSR